MRYHPVVTKLKINSEKAIICLNFQGLQKGKETKLTHVRNEHSYPEQRAVGSNAKYRVKVFVKKLGGKKREVMHCKKRVTSSGKSKL